MNIYSPELKSKIVHEYLERKNDISISELSRQHDIDPRRVGEWIRNYQLRGKIITQPNKRKFSQKFKEDVVDYYQTHEETLEQVAARFDVRPTQVSSWKNTAQRYGNEALASQKEKAAKTMEHKQKETQQLTKEDRNKHEMAAEIARLRAELDKTKKELYYARMDRDIAKKVQALVKASASKPKRK
ncbi:transposase [Limosilactobacillus allomucosae]|uniref:Transposase n=1 Tax=Limosilactobacillus allomucosae TaxID=3142938 RepID=A0ABV0I584_9LACO